MANVKVFVDKQTSGQKQYAPDFLGSSNSEANKDFKNMDKWGYNYLTENIVGKGEISPNEQFLLFPHCFQKLPIVNVSK